MLKPVAMAANLIEHRYLGGANIAGLRGIKTMSERQPEEWLAATVSRSGQGLTGLSRTDSGEFLRELVAGDPNAWVGPGHALARNSYDVGILFKLLDAGQRLGVHAHPDRAFAQHHLDCPYGKTEAWLVLKAEAGSGVYLGWKTDVDRDELDRRRDAQDSEWMLAHMNRVQVERGMGILVPAGTAHSIDSGVFVAEVQEPTDFSILLEWSITTSTREQSHLGLGFDRAMEAVSSRALPAVDLGQLVVYNDIANRHELAQRLLPPSADPFFRLDLLAPTSGGTIRVEAGFAVLVVLSGTATVYNVETEVEIRSGEVFAVPYAFGPWEVVGTASTLIARAAAEWPDSL